MQKRPRARKTRNAAGLTAAQLRTVEAIASERRLELPDSYEHDAPFCRALLDCLAVDGRLVEAVRFVNNVTREVEAGASPDDLARKHDLPATFAATMHAYARKQLGYAGREDWERDLDRLNRIVAEDDALV
jgi:hypothetical protein